MTPRDIYALEPEEVFSSLWMISGAYFDHLPEVLGANTLLALDRIEVKVVREYSFDHRRYWRLATLWFEGHPVMIFQNAGREGDDHYQRFITDRTRFAELVSYLNSLLHASDETDFVQLDQHLAHLTEFHGMTLQESYLNE